MGPNLKNLIAGFLLLAVAVTSSAIFFMTQQGGEQDVATPPTTPEQKLPKSVFVEDPGVENPAFYEAGRNLLAKQGPDPLAEAGDNLTERLIAALGQGLEQTNPQGPLALNGQPGLQTPDVETILKSIGGADDVRRLVPDWESEIAFSYRPQLVAGARPEDIARYRTAHSQLFQKYFNADPELIIVSFSPEDIRINDALREARVTPTPEPLVAYQNSLLKLLAYQQKASDLAQIAQKDPLKTSIIIGVQEQNYFAAIATFEQEARRATSLGLLRPEDERTAITALFYAAFGIQTAHAQWVTTDLAKIARRVWEYLKKVATEFLKDRLVHQLVTQTIKWIQGGGKPQFVTNWKGFLSDVANDQAGRIIEKYAPRFCQSFGPLVRVAVIPVDYNRDLDAGPVCTLDQVVGNIKEFAQSFENGGWVAYGAAMQPSNNFFGAMIQLSDIVDMEAAKKREASQGDVQSSSGFLSNKECVKWKDSTYDTCLAQLSDYCQTNNLSVDDCYSLEDAFCSGLDTTNECEEYRNTTPGETLYGAVSDSIKAPLERIVNAKDLIALLNALINAALSKLTQLGQSVVSKGILGLNSGEAYDDQSGPIDQGPSGGGGGGGGGGSGQFQGAVTSAVNSCGSSNGVSDGGCSPPWRINAGQENAFVQCVASSLGGAGLTAIQDPNAGDEIAVKRDNSFSEQYDVLTSSGCAWNKYNGTDTPAWF